MVPSAASVEVYEVPEVVAGVLSVLQAGLGSTVLVAPDAVVAPDDVVVPHAGVVPGAADHDVVVVAPAVWAVHVMAGLVVHCGAVHGVVHHEGVHGAGVALHREVEEAGDHCDSYVVLADRL